MDGFNIALASDHGGFAQKEQLESFLTSKGCTCVDYGCKSEDSVDYPDFALPAAQAVADGQADFGVLVCGTGLGMMLAANKVEGIRAVNITSVEFARLAREHNNANVITLSGRFVELAQNEAILEEFLTTPFSGGRHERRVAKIMAIEQSN